MKKFGKFIAVLTALVIGLVCASCSNSSGGGGGNNGKVLSTWIGSDAGAGITFTVYDGNTCKATAAEGTWEATYTGDIDAASGTISITVTKASSGARVYVGEIFTGRKISATVMTITQSNKDRGTYTKQ